MISGTPFWAECSNDLAAGIKASSIVRSPSLAPPLMTTASTALLNILEINFVSPETPFCLAEAHSDRRKIRYNAPEVPPILLATVPVIASKVSAGSLRGYVLISSKAAIEPSLKVSPQSPSPTLRSQAVSSGSAAFKAKAIDLIISSATLPFAVRTSGRKNFRNFSRSKSKRWSVGPRVRAPPPLGQPGALVSASSLRSSFSRSNFDFGSLRIDREKPAISMEVIRGPVTTRRTFMAF
mmetsp:Transcript_7753/g.12031  ORF Transcript_7753/g.12031 Transcript_7753/m.12031 type:complete len:238 (+) Transcript_7753:416-1129(+)